MANRFNQEVAGAAIQYAMPIIETLMEAEVAKRQDLYIVVGNSDGEILETESIGDSEKWEYPYDDIAKSKFKITARTGKPTRIVQQIEPELAGDVGDTFYWGSWIEGGIVVACSGVQPHWDEAFSKTIVAMVRAIITDKQIEEMKGDGNFR